MSFSLNPLSWVWSSIPLSYKILGTVVLVSVYSGGLYVRGYTAGRAGVHTTELRTENAALHKSLSDMTKILEDSNRRVGESEQRAQQLQEQIDEYEATLPKGTGVCRLTDADRSRLRGLAERATGRAAPSARSTR